MGYLDKYKVDTPEGVSGVWKVEKFTVTKEQAEFDALRGMFHGGRCVPAGTYTGLFRNGEVIMSDTPDEIRDHLSFIYAAKGKVLIVGLGLGVVARAVLEKPEVEHVTVMDNSEDVMNLVRHTLEQRYGDRVDFVLADVMEYKPSKSEYWDYAWFDIWDNLCSDNLPQMAILGRRFNKNRCGDAGFWGREHIKYYKRTRGW
jgi:hypothetical protein